ncbi:MULTISPECIES: DUF1444 domain-containing protein [Clostridia]|uniref:DUF1444 domain-containing protein n=1 Tax=Clostridia TaxID=186801 RepID=UPI000EA01A61|nr:MULTISPECIES: DUF1444 domain-containing protein [Clostridia]NBJ69046.1 DUF1444 domain-containing protein [Roseburia sp. 1XD42-34]RKI79947.1 DUF1444 domain-containing protein [Clostridium sp. 1xD42-85]
MQMTSLKLKKILDERFQNSDWYTMYNRDKDTFRIEWKSSKQGITITLSNVVAKYHQKGEAVIDELEEHVKEALRIMNEDQQLEGMEKQIFPVIRSTSFPTKTNANKPLIYKEHTAETRIFYAIDLGKSYRLIDQPLIEKEGWSETRIDEIASFNLRSLPVDYKLDRVADNDFYFLASQDGYDASRILNEAFLEEMKANSKGEMAVAVPHQDVLIVADVQNKTGYDILAQMTMKFFAEGRIPITSLPMIYDEKQLEPIFILAKNRPETDN